MAGHRGSVRRRRKRRLILFVVEIVLLVLALTVLYYYQKLNLIEITDVDQTKIEVNDVEQETIEAFEGYTTIAVFGLDNRTQGVYSSGNSDVIMILNINNDTKEMSMVSVYRDTYLDVSAADSNSKFRKANAAFAYGGVEQAITMLNTNLDLDIDNYVCVDFAAVAEAIDILGGVDIEIESSSELKYLNDYIVATNKILGTSSSTISTVGEHTLDGVQAVAYTRIRYTSGNDYKRTERQRRVLSQMLAKAKTANLSQINELINTVFPDIETNLSKKEILTMATAVLSYDLSNSGGFPFDKTTMDLGSIGSIVVPCDLASNVIQLHEFLFGTEEYTPSATVQEYSNYIISVTGKDADDAVDDEFSDADDFTGTKSSSTEDTDEETQ